MLHTSLSAAAELMYKADELATVLHRAEQLLKSAQGRARAQTTGHGAALAPCQDVLLADVLGDTVVGMELSLEEARALLVVLGLVRETVYERVLWREALAEAQSVAGVARRRPLVVRQVAPATGGH